MAEAKEEIVLNDDELICVLTGDKKKANAKEQMLQSVIVAVGKRHLGMGACFHGNFLGVRGCGSLTHFA